MGEMNDLSMSFDNEEDIDEQDVRTNALSMSAHTSDAKASRASRKKDPNRYSKLDEITNAIVLNEIENNQNRGV